MSAATACSARPAVTAAPKQMSVNGVVISRAEIARETQHHPAARPIEAMKAAAAALAVRELLLQEARRLAIPADPASDGEGRRETDEEAMIRALVEREVTTPQADDAACRRYYEQNRQRFRTAALYEARHILLAAAPSDKPARAEAAEVARILITQLETAPDSFAALAEAHSACPSGKTGGNLGQIGPGQTVTEFEHALAAMEPGGVHPMPVETRYGLHVVALDRRIDGRDLPYDLVRDRIAGWLNEKVRRTAIQQYVSILAGRADITGIDLAASASPLVQ